MISHVTVGTADLERAEYFYTTVLSPLGWKLMHTDDQYRGFSTGVDRNGRPLSPMFWACLPFDGQPAGVGNGVHVAFLADADQVEEVYDLAIATGGADAGAPAMHPEYHGSYYAAFFRDPDGNKLQVCCHTARAGLVRPRGMAGPTSGGCG